MKKYSILILGAVLIVIFGFVVVKTQKPSTKKQTTKKTQSTQQNQATEKKTKQDISKDRIYKNTDHKFQLTVPAGLYVTEEKSSGNNLLYSLGADIQELDELGDMNPLFLLQIYKTDPKQLYENSQNMKNIKISGLDAKGFEKKDDHGNTVKYLVVKSNNKVLAISTVLGDSSSEKMFQKIYESFSLTK